MGPASPMRPSAISYLRVRALGTPAATLWLVANGVFRGLGDTKTPLKYSIAFTALNAVLDPLFIFTLGFGASGAAAGMALAQYAALVPLLRSLHRRVGVNVRGRWREMGGTLREYARAGSYVFLRTLGKVLPYSVCARQAVSPPNAAAPSLPPRPSLDSPGPVSSPRARRCSAPSTPRPTTSPSSWGSPPPRSASWSRWRCRPCWRASSAAGPRRGVPGGPPHGPGGSGI